MIDSITLPVNALLHDRYRVIRCIGGGGFSRVFEVEDCKADEQPNEATNRTPIKVLKLLNLDGFWQPQTQQKAIALFQREAEFLSQFQHPGVPQVEPDGYFVWFLDPQTPLHCLVMEKIAGINLQVWLQQQESPLSELQAIHWMHQAVEILFQLHQRQVFHRDIKPSNIMLRPNGQLVLIDFGAVREISVTYLAKQQLQETGTAIVSAGYTPPEQAEGRAVLQSDFFALGRTFVYLLTRSEILELPKDSQTGALCWRDRAPQISTALANLIDTLMAPVPEHRPPSCEAIMRTLDRIERRLIWQRWLPLGKYFRRWRFTQNRHRSTVAVLVSLLLLGIFRSQLSIGLNDQGVAAHEAGNMTVAQWFYRAALLINHKNSSANFNLGDLFETQQQFEQAKAAYYFALANDATLWKAYNNLARLEILDHQPEKAISLLKKVNLNSIDDPVDRYAVLKNLGWAQLELKQYETAQQSLQSAITLDPKLAAARCLMVPVYKAQANKPAALAELNYCLQSVEAQNPDDQRLSVLAQNALPSDVTPDVTRK